MTYRSALEIKKAIFHALQDGEIKLKQLERRTKTDSRTLLKHLEELEWFGIVEVRYHHRSKTNGQPYRTVRIQLNT